MPTQRSSSGSCIQAFHDILLMQEAADGLLIDKLHEWVIVPAHIDVGIVISSFHKHLFLGSMCYGFPPD